MVTRHWGALVGLVSLMGIASLTVACGDDDDDNSGTAGTAGQAAAGTAGAAGGAGEAGAAGAGAGGAAGSGGSAGSGDPPGTCKTAEECASFKTTPPGAAPPAKPADAPAPGDGALIQAVDQLFIGDTLRDGSVPDSADAWNQYGFDLDGWTSTSKQGFHCQPQEGGKSNDIRADGPGGLDNSFGRNLLDLIGSLVTDPSKTVTDSIKGGSFSIVLKMEKLDTATTPTATATGVRTQLFAVAGAKDADGKAVAPPAADWSAYQWHPYPQLLEANGESKVVFPDAYVTGNTWVSGGQGTVNLSLSLSGQSLDLAINKAQISVKLSDDHKTGSDGIIGGILETEQLIASLKKIAGSFDTSLCGNSTTFEGIAATVRGASDIMVDGSQDAAKVCNGISIGLGFNSRASALGEKAPEETSEDPCKDVTP